MNFITLDGSKFTDKETFHSLIKSNFKLPDYYGCNLDALWDCITTDVQLPMTLTWLNFEKSFSYLGDYALLAEKLFKKAELYHNGNFKFRIL